MSPKNIKLLSIGTDSKTVKGEKQGYLTGIAYLAPAALAGGKTLCPFSTAECRALCLNTAGLGGVYKSIQEARIAKAQLWLNEPAKFLEKLAAEIESLIRRAGRENMIPVIRLNGTTDILWEKTGIMESFPKLTFYDYTKFPANLRPTLPENYHLTYSFTGLPISEKFSNDWAARGINTAVVFRPHLPAEFLGRPVLNGDLSDLRFLDEPGQIVGLKAKGKARAGVSSFVVDVGPDSGRTIPAEFPTAIKTSDPYHLENVFGLSFEDYLEKPR